MPKVAAITIYVHDMVKALEFYRDKLGFDIVHASETIVHLECEALPIILEKESKPSTAKYPGTAQLVLGIATENLERTMVALKRVDVEFVHDSPQDFPGGVFAAIKDPSGNILELLEFKKRD